MLREDEEGRRIVLISCRTYGSKPDVTGCTDSPYSIHYRNTERFVSEFLRHEGLYQPLQNKENWRQTFLLRCHHAHLCLLLEFLQKLATGHEALRGIFDARSSELRRWQLKEITASSYAYHRLKDASSELTETTESLLDYIKASLSDGNTELHEATHLRTRIEPDIRGLIREIDGRLSRLIGSLEHDLKFLDLSRDVHQTNSVNRLTLLATIFLPLSLSAGVLSMQSRFRDLGSLLYDFIGTTVILVAIVVLLLGFLSLLAFFKDGESKLNRAIAFYRKNLHSVFVWIGTISLALLGALVLCSFLVGMFKDVGLGLKILGYGFAAVAAIACIGLLIPVCFGVLLYCMFNRASYVTKPRRTSRFSSKRGKQQQEDVERRPAQGMEMSS
ncbi:Fc.00g107110.m01.CDS01 [Cosmosporella sp. VM-42]